MNEWKSAELLFSELNNRFTYLVLRNHENFFDSILLDNHSDVDLLCYKHEKNKIVKLINAIPRLSKNDGIHYKVLINGKYISFDIRCTGDGYYDASWEKNMLASRFMNSIGFYQLNNNNYYWSLLYHSLYHKGAISDEYLERLSKLSNKRLTNNKEILAEELHQYMINNNYYYTYSRDRYLGYYFTERCRKRLKGKAYFDIQQTNLVIKELITNCARKMVGKE